MPGKTTAYSDSILNVLRGTARSAITPYVGLFSTAPSSDSDSGTELSGSGYARQAVTFGAPTAGTGSSRRIANTNQITFGPATAAWATAVAFGIWDAASGGNLLYYGQLLDSGGNATTKTAAKDDTIVLSVGSLRVEED